MIETLRIEGLAIVEKAELEFGPGLNVLTGETGAGKSIVRGALGLLSGARATADTLRDGHDTAVVEAVFRTERQSEFEAELAERGIDTEDHELVVRRTISRAGRSRAQIAGQLAPVATLGELLGGRLEISSQHDSQRLRRPEVHGELLDRIGGLGKTRDAVAEGVRAIRELDAEVERLRAESAARARQQDFLSFQVQEIDEASLDVAEEEALRADRARLAHAGRLGEEGTCAVVLLSGDSQRADDACAADQLAEAARIALGLATVDPQLGDLAERLAGAQAEVRDAALELERYVAGIEADPSRLARAEERLHQIEQLQRKYGATLADVLEFRDAAARELASIEGADEREAEILAEREPLVAKLEKAAKKLSRGRAKAAKRLSESVQDGLRQLAMPRAEFSVALDRLPAPEGLPCGPGGREAPEFFFTANPGEAPRPLRKVASGGELSRAFLAVKNAAREADGGMVLVFDEVDAGIGGQAADRVGRTLAELAAHHQVLCITHLPQVAAFADTHFKVEKIASEGRTRTRISQVEGPDRVEEIARMAGGREVGEATRRHARELLGSRGESSRARQTRPASAP